MGSTHSGATGPVLPLMLLATCGASVSSGSLPASARSAAKSASGRCPLCTMYSATFGAICADTACTHGRWRSGVTNQTRSYVAAPSYSLPSRQMKPSRPPSQLTNPYQLVLSTLAGRYTVTGADVICLSTCMAPATTSRWKCTWLTIAICSGRCGAPASGAASGAASAAAHRAARCCWCCGGPPPPSSSSSTSASAAGCWQTARRRAATCACHAPLLLLALTPLPPLLLLVQPLLLLLLRAMLAPCRRPGRWHTHPCCAVSVLAHATRAAATPASTPHCSAGRRVLPPHSARPAAAGVDAQACWRERQPRHMCSWPAAPDRPASTAVLPPCRRPQQPCSASSVLCLRHRRCWTASHPALAAAWPHHPRSPAPCRSWFPPAAARAPARLTCLVLCFKSLVKPSACDCSSLLHDTLRAVPRRVKHAGW
jgi:hypothetical protein